MRGSERGFRPATEMAEEFYVHALGAQPLEHVVRDARPSGYVRCILNADKTDPQMRLLERLRHGGMKSLQTGSFLIHRLQVEAQRGRVRRIVEAQDFVCLGGEGDGAPGEIRTPDLMLRRHSLYPAELRAPVSSISYFGLQERG